MVSHVFDEAVRLTPDPNGRFVGHTHPAYGNMVGPYGGITAAQLLAGVVQHPQRQGEPVSVTVNFCAPVADGPFEIEARPLRTNRSTQHWMVLMHQADAVVASATVVTAVPRPGWVATEHPMPAGLPPADQVAPPPGVRPVEWIKRYDMRFIEGGLPTHWDGQDRGQSRSRLWVRDEPPRPLDALSLTALADVFFPRVWVRRGERMPVGTVSITVYLLADAATLAHHSGQHLLAQAQAQAFGGGFFDQAAQLWAPDGLLLATTHQVVYFKG